MSFLYTKHNNQSSEGAIATCSFKLERLDPRGVDLEQGCQVAHNARPIEVGLCGKTPTVFEFRAETGRVRG